MLTCPWEPATLFFFSSNVPSLVHYSHLAAVLAAITIAGFVFSSDPSGPVNRLFLVLVAFFSSWTILDVILWATNRPDVVMFAWSLQVLLEPLTYVTAFFLFYRFMYKRWPDRQTIVILSALLLPVVLLLSTTFNIGPLYLSSCEAAEGFIAKYYTHFVHTTLIILISLIGAKEIPRIHAKNERYTAFLLCFGLIALLLAFSSGTIIGSLTDDWVPSQYGLFGMPVFAACIAYSIIRFRAFNAHVLTASVLVVALGVGVLSLTALRDIGNVRLVSALTFLIVCIVGYNLIRNVRREVEQRILIQRQEEELAIINQQQESLLHFISHEVKGFLTEGQNAFAGISEGDFGEPAPKIKDIAKIALVRMRAGVNTVMDILDASNLKRGTISYAKTTFDLKSVVESIVAAAKTRTEEKHVSIDLTADAGDFNIAGDAAKIQRHVIRNIIDNAIRYTPSGSIHVHLSQTPSGVRMVVEDTGVGITAEDMTHLFTEGGHGKESLKVNVDSTGFGLFVAKKVVEAHHGKVWAESEGKGKGSRFIIELPRG